MDIKEVKLAEKRYKALTEGNLMGADRRLVYGNHSNYVIDGMIQCDLRILADAFIGMSASTCIEFGKCRMKPLTAEEAEKAFDKAVAIEMSKEEIDEIVKRVTGE